MKNIILFGGIVLVILVIWGFSNISSDVPKEQEKITEKEILLDTKIEEDIPNEVREYTLDFSAYYIVGKRAFKITGTTNLPNTAILYITIKDENYYSYDSRDPDWRFENLTYITSDVSVTNGSFSKIVTASAIEAPLTSKKYSVEVSFNPRNRQQSAQVKEQVGANGEYLGGALIDTSVDGLTLLEKEIIINLADGASSVVWDNPKAQQICSDNPSWTKNDCERLADNKIWIGMSYEMLKYKRGLPESADPSNYGSGVEWQWCWYDFTPNCFYDDNNDGLIDSYN